MKLRVRNNRWLAPSNSPLSDFFEANEFLNDGSLNRVKTPAVNIFENEEEYTIELAAPGMEKDDFTVKVDDGVLTISAESSEKKNDEIEGEYSHREYDYSSFCRSFNLPGDAMEDEIEACYEGGELIISIPKAINVVTSGREIEIV